MSLICTYVYICVCVRVAMYRCIGVLGFYIRFERIKQIYVIFSKIHDDVGSILFRIPDFGLRYNYRNEPVEEIDLSFRFERELKKVKNLSELAAN